MRFRVSHSTRYQYTVPVLLAEHTLRLLPQLPPDAITQHQLTITPVPSAQRVAFDRSGNRVLTTVFDGATSVLSVESEFDAWVSAPAMLSDPGWPALPWLGFLDAVPHGTTFWSSAAPVDPNVSAFAHATAQDAGHRPLAFLELLTLTLFQRMDQEFRLEGNARSSAETLSTSQGACRDVTALFLDCCLALGISGRFTSGYQAVGETPDTERYLHAWPEVYLPGLGWRGWDATNGIPVTDGHLALCGAATQAETMPVQGGFYFAGPSVSSTLTHRVRIQTSLV